MSARRQTTSDYSSFGQGCQITPITNYQQLPVMTNSQSNHITVRLTLAYVAFDHVVIEIASIDFVMQ
jgi:hypothetical protein